MEYLQTAIDLARAAGDILTHYLSRDKQGGMFSFNTLLNEELRLDRDEEGQGRNKGKGNS